METSKNSLQETNNNNNSNGAKKHFVLVHGACHGAWCWYKLIPLLKTAGYRVTVLDLAGSGINPKQVKEVQSFSDYVQPLMDFMENSVPNSSCIKPEEKVILVGHSMGGFSISKAMETFSEKISVAIFIAALMPNPLPDFPLLFQEGTRGDSRYTYNNNEGPEKKPNTFVFGPNYLSSDLYQLSPSEDWNLATMLVRPIKIYSNEDLSKQINVSKEKYGSVRRVYIVPEQDKAIPKHFQYSMIENDLIDEVKEINGSDHMVMLSKPHELFACLQEIVEVA